MASSLFWLLWPVFYAFSAAGVSTFASLSEVPVVQIVSTMAALALPFRSIWYIVLAKKNHSRLRPGMLIQTALEIILSLLFIFLPRVSYQWFLVFLGLYFSFHMALNIINTVIYSKNRTFQYFIPSLAQAVLFTYLFFGLFFTPSEMRYQMVISGSGFFLSLLGQSYIMDLLSVIIKNKSASNAFRRVSLILPGFAGLGIPYRLIHTLQNDGLSEDLDAEVFFCFGKGGKGAAGHCELCIDGRTYTYGNYDPESRFLFKIGGNGIIVRANRELQIQNFLREGRTVVSYGLKLSPEQKKRLMENLAAFEQTLCPWDEEAKRVPAGEHLSTVHRDLEAQVFRIQKGRFKSYFIPTINCVTLTASLLKGTSAGNAVIPGVYTPGAYMDTFHRLYIAGQDIVACVNVFRPEHKEVSAK